MSVSLDGEEARQIRRTEDSGQHIVDSNLNRELGSKSCTDGLESFRANRDNGSTGDNSRYNRSRKTTTGKMISQLICEYRDQVASKTQELERLQSRIQELELLLEELENQTEENP